MFRAFSRLAPKLALGAGAVALALALPSSVVAIGLIDSDSTYSDLGNAVPFTPASADPQLVRLMQERSGGKLPLMRFTPASSGAEPAGRSVTVAVRVDQQFAQALANRSVADAGAEKSLAARGLPVASTRYNLGLARGYSSFARAPEISSTLSRAEIPDLSEFDQGDSAPARPSRFAARIELEQEMPAARSAEAVERPGDQRLDVAGSYRLTRNLDVTAGVRYEQDRELRPLPDIEAQDSQAVYIGTQFRF